MYLTTMVIVVNLILLGVEVACSDGHGCRSPGQLNVTSRIGVTSFELRETKGLVPEVHASKQEVTRSRCISTDRTFL